MKRFKTFGFFWWLLILSSATCFADTVVATPDVKSTLINSLLTALATALVGLLAWIGKKVGKFVNAKIEDIDNDVLQKTAYVAVRYAQDAFKNATGKEKFGKACSYVATKLPGVSGDDIETAVHAMYINFSGEITKNE